MAINLNIQADVIDIRSDTPLQSDIFLVDTNVWFWQTYTNPGFAPKVYQISSYPNYLNQALSNGATLTYSGLILAELAHIIEKSECGIYIKSHGYVSTKEYRHNYPMERANVVADASLRAQSVYGFALPWLTYRSATAQDLSTTRTGVLRPTAYTLPVGIHFVCVCSSRHESGNPECSAASPH
jgi:hypothetical protein